MWDVLPVDGEVECVAIDNIIILGILDNRVDLNDNPVDLRRLTSNDDGIVVFAIGLLVLGSNLDIDELIFTNESIENSSILTDDEPVPFLFDLEGFSLDVGRFLGETFEFGRSGR